MQHLEHLMFYGADMDVINASGNTPLHICAVNNMVRIPYHFLFIHLGDISVCVFRHFLR